jgi:hypothetical protein
MDSVPGENLEARGTLGTGNPESSGNPETSLANLKRWINLGLNQDDITTLLVKRFELRF